MKGNLLNTKQISLLALFAALYFILSLLPGIPVIGLPEITIELEASFASLFGVILGPYLGALAAFIGALLAFFYGGALLYNLPFIFSPAVNALTVGLIYKRRIREAFTLFTVIIFAFWLTPPANPVFSQWYVGLAATFDKIIALLLIAPVARMMQPKKAEGAKADLEPSRASFLILLMLSFIGNQADAALGNLFFALPQVYGTIFGLDVETVRFLFVISPLAYPMIRMVQAVIAASVGLPLISALGSRGWLTFKQNEQ